MGEMLEIYRRERRKHDALIKVAEEAVKTAGWLHSVGLAGRGESGSRILKGLEDAINELDKVVK